jgi:hypothetical protein
MAEKKPAFNRLNKGNILLFPLPCQAVSALLPKAQRLCAISIRLRRLNSFGKT